MEYKSINTVYGHILHILFTAHPWTNFYKSKDYNRHPDMPKKPLSMYMLYYSEKREEILADQPKLSMPEVAKICSEQYQKLSDKKKARYAIIYCSLCH